MSSEAQIKSDKEFLLTRPEFLRHLGRIAIQMGQIFDHTGSGKSERDLAYAEGRRDLVMEILSDLEEAQPEPSAQGPLGTTIQILLAQAQSASTEKRKDGRRNDRYRDLADGSDGDGHDGE